MPEGKIDSRTRKIAQLQAQVRELQAKLASLLDDGLRLSQENEALRLEIAALKKSRK